MSWQAGVPCLANGWTTAAALPGPVLANAVVAQGGKVYSLGGAAVLGTPIPDAYRFDPATNLWTPLAPLPAARQQPAAVSDGTHIYVVGGTDATGGNPVATLFRYDPVADSWTTLASSNVPTTGAAAAYLNGKIYRIGGLTTGNAITPSVEVYTLATNSWAGVAPYPIPSEALYALTLGNYIYAAGGITSFTPSVIPTNKTYRYDPATNTWNDSAIADLPGGRSLGAGDLYNGRWLLAGGTGDGRSLTSSAVAWDPATDTWSSLGALTTADAYTAGASAGGSFYVVGGAASAAAGSNLVRQYTEAVPSFADVHPTDYFYGPVGYLACRGVISGYGDGTFRPFNPTTRAQMVKIVTLGLRLPPFTPPTGYTFADVPPVAPFWSVIETAAHDGVVSGYACGGPGEPCDGANRPYFRPNVDVTRGQLSKIVVVAAGWPLRNPPAPGSFADVLAASPFYQFVETAACYGVVSGYACGGPGETCDATHRPYFRLGNTATRGQIAKIVYLAVNHPAACAAPEK